MRPAKNNTPSFLLTAAACALVLAALTAARADPPSDLGARIKRLVEQLGSDKWAEREAAMKGLTEIGLPALPALREAVRSPNLELSLRAVHLCKLLTSREPQLRQAARSKGYDALRRGNYEEMITHFRLLAAQENLELIDLLWLGHACQLSGNWPEAVAAYQQLAGRMDAAAKEPPGPARAAREGVSPLDMPGVREHLAHQQVGLLLLIGRLQREELKDLKAAAATFEKLATGPNSPDWRINLVRRDALRELAVTQELAGRFADAIRNWKRVEQTSRERFRQKLREHPNYGGAHVHFLDPVKMGGLLRKLPAAEPAPKIPGLIALTEKDPAVKLLLGREQTTARAYGLYPSPTLKAWFFALSPPRGKQFAALEIDCDIEQFQLGVTGQFGCRAFLEGQPGRSIEIGSIGWPRATPTGREVQKRRFDVPPGSGVVCMEVQWLKDKYRVHSVEVRATFREPRPASAPPPGAVIQTEVLPAGGTLTWERGPMRPGSAYHGVEPGRYLFTYELPGRQESFRCEGELLSGARYGLFVNLDSPFRPALTNLRQFSELVPSRPSLLLLPEGRWLAAYAGGDRRIRLSSSTDLVRWEAPRPLPHNSIFNSVAPTLWRDAQGTIQLAYFSNRLHLGSTSDTIGYRMWLTSSTDGVKWSRPRPIAVGEVTGWPLDSIQLLHGPAGGDWIFWRHLGGAAKKLDQIDQLEPMLPDAPRPRVYNANVAFDADGQMHLVFDDWGQGIYYSRLQRGRQWRPPVELVARPRGKSVSCPQLFLQRRGAVLIYEQSGAAYLRRLTLADPPRLGRAIKIASHIAPLCGARACLTKGGQVVLLAGKDTAWALRADLEDLFAQPGGE